MDFRFPMGPFIYYVGRFLGHFWPTHRLCTYDACTDKAKLLLLKPIQIFAWAVSVMKKLEIEETKTTWCSTFKTDTIKLGLVFSISHFFIIKTARANKWMRKKIPSCSNSALVYTLAYHINCKGYTANVLSSESTDECLRTKS